MARWAIAVIAALALLVGAGAAMRAGTDAQSPPVTATAVPDEDGKFYWRGGSRISLTVGTVYESDDYSFAKSNLICVRTPVLSVRSFPVPGMHINSAGLPVGMPTESGTWTWRTLTKCQNDLRDRYREYHDIAITTSGTLPAHCSDYWRTGHCNDEHPDHASHRSRIAALETENAALKAKIVTLEAASHSTHIAPDLSAYYTKEQVKDIVCDILTESVLNVLVGSSADGSQIDCFNLLRSSGQSATPVPAPLAPAPSAPTPTPRATMAATATPTPEN